MSRYLPGYYGKLPQRGDFIKAGLSPELISKWDHWLSDGLEFCKQTLGENWLARYLQAPIWRFYIAPGVLEKNCLIGVFFPSVDKVGRYFPFTLMCALPDMPNGWLGNERIDEYYARLEKIGMVALDEACDIEDMEEALGEFDWPFPTVHREPPEYIEWAGRDIDRYKMLSNHFFSLSQPQASQLTLWWTTHGDGKAQYFLHQGMPEANQFIQFI
jgi:type VI secretion system ImpM family protein